MGENQKRLQKYLTYVVIAEEREDTLENLVFVESVLEKKQMQENFLVLENQVGNKKEKIVLVL